MVSVDFTEDWASGHYMVAWALVGMDMVVLVAKDLVVLAVDWVALVNLLELSVHLNVKCHHCVPLVKRMETNANLF